VWRNLLIVGLVVAVGVAAVVDSMHGGDESVAASESVTDEQEQAEDGLTGPDVPAPGALPGALVLVEPSGCRIRQVVFSDGSIGDAGPETTCRVWVSPRGDLAVVPTKRGDLAGTREIALVRLGEEPEVVAQLGPAAGDVDWSSDGTRVAWCGPDDATVVVDIEGGGERRVPGCNPRFAPDGSILTRARGVLVFELLRDGEVVLGASDLAEGFDERGPLNIVGFDIAPDGLLAVTVALLAPGRTVSMLELWRDGNLETSIPLPEAVGPGDAPFGGYLSFSPNGNELAIGYSSGPGEVTLVDLDLQRVVVPPIDQRALAWSRDGAWLAVAVGDQVQIFGALRDVPAYTLPLAAVALGWGGGREPAEAP
jgi:hypothetical protein